MNQLETLNTADLAGSSSIANNPKTFTSTNVELTFQTSSINEIDANKYSFYDVFADARIELTSFEDRIAMLNSWIEDLANNKHCLYRRPLQSGCKNEVTIEDPFSNKKEKMINLASNDYLGLSQHPRVIEAAIKCLNENGAGSGGAPLLSGTTQVALSLEKKIAEMKGCEAALVFTSGYGANIGTLTTLLRKTDVVIYDMYAHASLLDGSSNTNRKFFKHNDMESLEAVLKTVQFAYKNKLVVVDGVYSMDGDIAPLDKIVDLAHKYGAWVLVDEAHSTGVLGENGKGTIEHFNLEGKVDIVTGTFSKAIGCVGGFVAGRKDLITFIQYGSRPYMFSTASFIPANAAALEAIQVIEEEPELRKKLWQNIHFMQKELKGAGFNIANSETAIFPLIIGNDFKVKEMSYLLHEAGVFVNSVPYPAVPRKITRVKLTVSAAHTLEQLDKALFEVKRIGKSLGII